jgi:G:T/U-mismatch repair DNA glycosylase
MKIDAFEYLKVHPWINKYSISTETRYLIIGTHPPMPYCGSLPFYYGNMNEFWKFMDQVYPKNNLYNLKECTRLEDIAAFLAKYRIAITDMVEETNGQPFSTDNGMNWTKLNSKLIDQFKASQVEIIYFTSSAGKNSALSLFKKWLKEHKLELGKQINIPSHLEWRNAGHFIELFDKKIKLEQLFSPSPTARRSKNKIREYNDWLLANPTGTFDEFRVDWYKRKLPQI